MFTPINRISIEQRMSTLTDSNSTPTTSLNRHSPSVNPRPSDWRSDIFKSNYNLGTGRQGYHRTATCNHCQRFYNSGKAGILIEHLQKCASTPTEVKQEIAKNFALQYERAIETKQHETESDELNRINHGLAKWLKLLDIPVRLVDRPAFREWTEKSFGYTPPTSFTIRTTYLPAVAAEVAVLKEEARSKRRKKSAKNEPQASDVEDT